MGLIDLTADLTYNTNFETEPVQNQTGPEINSNFQTSNIENQDVVGTQSSNIDGSYKGSVNFFQNPHGANEDGSGGFNISGFTQFMPKQTLYPLDGLNNSGIVDFFPSPHGVGHFGGDDVPHQIPGFISNFENFVKGTALNGVYPNTIQLGSVDFFPGGPFTNNINYATGFTLNMEPIGGSKLSSQYDIDTYYVVEDLQQRFNVTSGIPNPGLSVYSPGLKSQYTTDAEVVDGDVSWNLKIGAAGLGDTNPPYTLDSLQSGLQNWNIATSGYLGEVNFFSDSDSYATGFTKNMQPIGGDKLDSQYDISTYYTDEELTFNGITQGTPSPGLSQYSAGLESQYTSIAEGVNGDVDWNLQIGAAGLGDAEPPYSLDQLKDSLPSMNIETSGYLGSVDFFPGGNFSNNFTTSTGFTKNAEAFGEDKITTEFLMIDGDTISQTFLNNEMFRSIKIDGTYTGAVDFISDTDSYATGFTKSMEPLGGNKLDTQYDIDKFYTDEVGSFNVKGFSISQFVPDTFNSVAGITSYGLSPSIFTTDVEGTETPEFSVYSLGNFQPGGVAGLSYPVDVDEDGNITQKPPFGKDDLIGGMESWNVGGFNIEDFTNFGDNSFGKTSYGSSDYDSFLGIPTGPDGDDVGSIKLHLNKGVFESGFSGENAYSYANIPSLKSVPRPEYTAVSGPFSTNSGFAEGDFKLGINDDGIVPRYLDTGDGREAAEGSIVRKVDGSNLRSGATSIRDLLEQDGDYDGTIFRDIKKMSGMAQTIYGTGYGDGINDGWMKGLIDTSVPIGKDFSGNSADFFIRESSGGRFLGRIAKDLIRMSKWQFSSNGLMSLAKNGVMTLFNQSEKSLQLSAPASFVTLIGNMFGLRTTSAFSSIGSLVLNAIGAKSDESMLYYEARVDRKHPSNGAVGGTFLQSLNPLPPDPIERTLTNRYGQPVYPKRGQLGGKGTRAHRLYATGLPKFDGTRFSRAVDEINILGYGERSSQYKDLIKFYFRDLRNNKTIVFRAFLTNIQDSVSPEWNNYRYIGRPDDVYVYKGTSRSVSFSMKVAAFTRWEMIPMWERINYLVGLNYGSYVDTKAYGEGQYYQNNPGMSSPICKMTIGDYLTEQTGYIKDFNISIPPDYPWDVIVDDGGKNVVGELPQVVDINMGFQIIPQQVPDSYGKHFGKVGTNDTIGESGLSWLPDMHDHTKNLLNEFKSKHDTYVSDKGLNLVGDVENENTSNEDEPDLGPGEDAAAEVPFPPE